MKKNPNIATRKHCGILYFIRVESYTKREVDKVIRLRLRIVLIYPSY